MTRSVIDASRAAKWFLPPSGEPLADMALRLLAGYADGRFRFAVPDPFWAECGNILWKAVRLKSHLVTAHERLANPLAAHLPVKWLGSVV